MSRAVTLALGVTLAATTLAARQPNRQNTPFQPARYRAGALFTLPNTVVGGGEVWLDVAVDEGGNVNSVTPLRATPPFTELFASAVRGWTFRPARDAGTASASHVFVAALIRPPSLTVGSTLGEQPRNVAAPSPALAVPRSTVLPAQNPLGQRSGVVLVELDVSTQGAVTRTAIVRSAPPFDSAATDAAAKWTFAAAQLRGIAVQSIAYVAFGFPEVVTSPSPH
jgi:TonB family protein